MTLFKRVFNKHTAGKAVTPVPSRQVEGPEAELDFDEEIVSGIIAVVGEQAADTPQISEGQTGAPDSLSARVNTAPRPTSKIAVQPEDEHKLQAPPLREVLPNPAFDPGMVERAQQAQRAIESSQTQPKADLRIASNSQDEAGAAQAPQQSANQAPDASAPIAAVRPGRAARRVRTRMLGFGQGIDAATDPFEKQKEEVPQSAQKYPVGWMVVVAGPGEGHSFAISNGVSTIGRGADQTVALDFGDSSVSRERHAAVAYDDENNSFFLGHGGKSNIVRLNGKPVLITEDLSDGDMVRIGETTLRFVALCGADFAWGKSDNDET